MVELPEGAERVSVPSDLGLTKLPYDLLAETLMSMYPGCTESQLLEIAQDYSFETPAMWEPPGPVEGYKVEFSSARDQYRALIILEGTGISMYSFGASYYIAPNELYLSPEEFVSAVNDLMRLCVLPVHLSGADNVGLR